MWVGLVIGFIIGAAAEIWGIANPETLIRLAKWEDRLFVACIALGFAIGTPVLFGLYAAGVGFHWGPKPFYVIGILINTYRRFTLWSGTSTFRILPWLNMDGFGRRKEGRNICSIWCNIRCSHLDCFISNPSRTMVNHCRKLW